MTGTAPGPGGAEFDAYARDYGAGMDNPLKAMLGETADDFLAVKLDWLCRFRPDLTGGARPLDLLDYGCGAADLLRLMAQRGLTASLAGCDISAGMLEEARRRWPGNRPPPRLERQDGAATPFPGGAFDLIVISAVLHHVPPAERPAVYAELRRLLRPGGVVVVFEHNPLNPVTRWVVSRTPIDANAILLRARDARAGLRDAGFGVTRTRYLMFAPPRLRRLDTALERALGWLPFGAQYAVTASVT